MRISVITSCTDTKVSRLPNQLTLEDFMQGREHVALRESEIAGQSLPAEYMYRGEQHVRLMRGVHAARQSGVEVRLWIVSAGYGLLSADTPIKPYNATFGDLSAEDARQWAVQLNLAQQVQEALAEPADCALILLGNAYLNVCGLDKVKEAPKATWALCGTGAVKRFSDAIRPIPLTKQDTRRFRAGLVGLKGEVAAQILEEPHGRFDAAVERISQRI